MRTQHTQSGWGPIFNFLLMRTLFAFLFLFTATAFAQTNKTNEYNAGVYYGPLIAGGSVSGVNEIVRMTGFKLSKGISHYRPEFFLHKGTSTESANHIDIMMSGLTFRNYINIQDLEGIRPFVLTGIQYARYTTTTVGTRSSSGFHLGFGIDYIVSPSLQFRSDFIFCNGGSGRILVVSLGVQFSFGDIKNTKNESSAN